MKQYLDLMRQIYLNGSERGDRTGTGTISLFGPQIEFDFRDGFPLLTTKRVFLKGVIHELLWMLKGDTNIKYLNDYGVHIWDEWADENGSLGPVYGKQWRSWPVFAGFEYNYTTDGREVDSVEVVWEGEDQIDTVIESLRNNPNSRRHIVSAWNVGQIDQMKLPPCHCLFQFYVDGDFLSCKLYQRSADLFLGVPFNIASYALLTMMVAKVTGKVPFKFIHSFGDVHIYKNHLSQCHEQMARPPRRLPSMEIDYRGQSIDGFKYEDFTLLGYDPHPRIKAEVSV